MIDAVPKTGWTSFSVTLCLQGSIWVPTESATCVMSPVCSAAVQRQRTAPAALKHGEDCMSCQKLQSSTAEGVYFQFSNPRGSKVNMGLHMAIPQSTWLSSPKLSVCFDSVVKMRMMIFFGCLWFFNCFYILKEKLNKCCIVVMYMCLFCIVNYYYPTCRFFDEGRCVMRCQRGRYAMGRQCHLCHHTCQECSDEGPDSCTSCDRGTLTRIKIT